MATVEEKASKLLHTLPKSVDQPELGEEANSNPIYRFLKRETGMAIKVLKLVRKDLSDTIEMCKGNLKPTNDIREVSKSILMDNLPKNWKMWVTDLNVTHWIIDLVKRINQLSTLNNSKDFGKSNMWLGGLFYPEAFLTATRQYVAQCIKVPLDELILNVSLLTF